MTVRIVTDSGCDLPEQFVAKHAITVVPLTFRFGNEEFTDRRDLTTAQFWEKCSSSPVLPETAAPSPGLFEQEFRRLKSEGATGIVVVALSRDLSATIQSATLAAEAVKDAIPVRIVDSRSASMGEGITALACARAAEGGASLDQVAALGESLAGRSKVWGALDTLENLKKGGRIGSAKALVGSMLSVKPLIHIGDGAVEEAGKQRTRKRALEWLRDQLFAAGPVEKLAILHGEAPDFDQFLDMISERYPREQIRIGKIGAVIGTHGGPGVIGMCYLRP